MLLLIIQNHDNFLWSSGREIRVLLNATFYYFAVTVEANRNRTQQLLIVLGPQDVAFPNSVFNVSHLMGEV